EKEKEKEKEKTWKKPSERPGSSRLLALVSPRQRHTVQHERQTSAPLVVATSRVAFKKDLIEDKLAESEPSQMGAYSSAESTSTNNSTSQPPTSFPTSLSTPQVSTMSVPTLPSSPRISLELGA